MHWIELDPATIDARLSELGAGRVALFTAAAMAFLRRYNRGAMQHYNYHASIRVDENVSLRALRQRQPVSYTLDCDDEARIGGLVPEFLTQLLDKHT